MNILVTGGTGFAGSHLVKRLLFRGHEVHVLDIQEGHHYKELLKLGARIKLGSVTDKRLVEESVDGCDIVYHTAAAFRQINATKKFYWDVNVEGTRNMLEASLNAQVKKFIHCSTIGIYGNVQNPPADENSHPSPADYYQYSKLEGEKIAKDYSSKGLYTVIIQPSGIYGPGDLGRFLILYRLVKKGVFFMFGDGNISYHTVYIDNLLDGFELVSEIEGINGQSFIIADEHYYTLNELVVHVARSMETEIKIRHMPYLPLWFVSLIIENLYKPFRIAPPLFRRRAEWFRMVRAFSIEKAKNILGYNPKIDLPEGLLSTATWYRDNGHI